VDWKLLDAPQGIAIDGAGTIYVTNFHYGQTSIRDPLITIPSGQDPGPGPAITVTIPVGVAVNTNNTVYVSQFNSPDLVVMRPGEKSFLYRLQGVHGAAGISIGRDGLLYVADTVGNQIVLLKAPY
jgi:serine/threonine-protein kinase